MSLTTSWAGRLQEQNDGLNQPASLAKAAYKSSFTVMPIFSLVNPA